MLITSMKRETRFGFLGLPDRDGWNATVDVDGATLMLSKLDGETEWLADALFSANGMPQFCHGYGDRLVAKRAAGDDLAVLLDAAAEKVNV